MRILYFCLTTFAALILVSACAKSENAPTPTAVRSPSLPTLTSSGIPDQIIEQAKSDLATRKGTTVSSIRVAKADAVDWSDSSLGCPKPGQLYAQVISAGFRIVLTFQGTNSTYHSSLTGPPFLCE